MASHNLESLPTFNGEAVVVLIDTHSACAGITTAEPQASGERCAGAIALLEDGERRWRGVNQIQSQLKPGGFRHETGIPWGIEHNLDVSLLNAG